MWIPRAIPPLLTALAYLAVATAPCAPDPYATALAAAGVVEPGGRSGHTAHAGPFAHAAHAAHGTGAHGTGDHGSDDHGTERAPGAPGTRTAEAPLGIEASADGSREVTVSAPCMCGCHEPRGSAGSAKRLGPIELPGTYTASPRPIARADFRASQDATDVTACIPDPIPITG